MRIGVLTAIACAVIVSAMIAPAYAAVNARAIEGIPQRQVCDQVRAFIAQHGYKHAIKMAREQGYSEALIKYVRLICL